MQVFQNWLYVSENMSHRFNEAETSRKFKACFSENGFPLVSCCVFSDSTNKSLVSKEARTQGQLVPD